MPEPLLPPEQLDALSQIPTELDQAIKALGIQPPPPGIDPETLIKNFRESWSKLPSPPPNPDVEESVSSYRTRDGVSLRICIYKPASASSPSTRLPLVVWYHGGGFCVGVPEMNAVLLREVAAKHNCIVVAPQYRLAPERKFPGQIEDGWDTLAHIAANADEFGADPRLGFIVGGESAGSRMTAVLSLQALEKNLQPPITGTFLSAGAYFDPDNVPADYKPHFRSRFDEQCLSSPFLSDTTKKAFDACLQPDNKSPMHNAALSSGHAGLPKTYLQACGADILRDDTFLYRHLLETVGVATRLDVYPGGVHCFWFMLKDTELGRKWQADSHGAFEWLLKA